MARAGVPSAVEAVVDRLRPRLTRMARFYAGRVREDADDLLQEAWVGLLEALGEIDLSIGDPEQYLVLRARWRLLDSLKRTRARSREVVSDLSSDRERPDDELECAGPDEEAHIIAALCTGEFAARLKPNQRTILECLMRGLTWREAGAVLGCTSANVAYHVRQIARAYDAWNAEPVSTFHGMPPLAAGARASI